MRRTILLLVLAASVALLAKEKPVKRLDGSTITAAEIDSTVTHLPAEASSGICEIRRFGG